MPKGRMPVHGEAVGGKMSAEYQAWCQMKQRCLNPKHPAYERYGARGITIVEEWIDSFQSFLKDVGRRPSSQHSLDRKENNLGYYPSNVRWATITQQNRNTRSTKMMEMNGETLCKAAWAERFGISKTLLQKRLDAGWSLEKSLTTKSRKKKTVSGAF